MESRGEVALARRGSGCGRRLVNSSIENAWDFSLLCLTRSLVHPSPRYISPHVPRLNAYVSIEGCDTAGFPFTRRRGLYIGVEIKIGFLVVAFRS